MGEHLGVIGALVVAEQRLGPVAEHQDLGGHRAADTADHQGGPGGQVGPSGGFRPIHDGPARTQGVPGTSRSVEALGEVEFQGVPILRLPPADQVQAGLRPPNRIVEARASRMASRAALPQATRRVSSTPGR